MGKSQSRHKKNEPKSSSLKEKDGLWKKVFDGKGVDARFDHSVVRVGGTKFLMFSGAGEGWKEEKDLWYFDLEKSEWYQVEYQVVDNEEFPGLKDHTAIFYKNKMIVFAGKPHEKEVMNDIWEFDIDQKKWTRIAADDSFPKPRCGHSALLKDETMIVYGGKGADEKELDDLWKFNLESKVWEQLETKGENKPQGMLYHSALLHNNEMLVLCGFRDSKPIKEFWSLQLDTLEWKQLDDPPFSPRSGHFAETDGDYIYLFGGETHENNYYNSSDELWVYNLKNKEWTQITKNKTWLKGRLGMKGCILKNNLIIHGGLNVSGEKWKPQEWFSDVWTCSLEELKKGLK